MGGPLPIPLRCLRIACRYGRSHKQRERPSEQANDPALPVLDRRQLVDLPSCLHLSNDWLRWLPRSVAIQVGYCISDIISKCGVGLVIYGVTAAKSESYKEGALLPQ